MRKKKRRVNHASSVRSLFASALIGLVFAGLFSGGVYVFATPPDSQYSPGDTLNPSCAVGSTNCSIVSPVPYTGATAAVNIGSRNFTTTGTSALGASTSLKYDSANYSTLTAASNGDLTIATTSATTGGNINLTSAITGDFTMLSNSGTLVLGGTGNSNNENLKLDFETYANKVAVTSGTSVADIDFGALNLITTGTLTLGGSTAGTLVTRVKAGAATESDTNGSLVIDSTNGRLYFRYGSAWHYVAQTAGFQIPDFETIDPLSGDQIKETDLVLGMVNQSFEDGALHGVWVKWDSVKADLIKELQGEIPASNFTAGFSGAPSAAGPETFLDKVKNGLFSLGISVKDGVAGIKELAAEKFSAKTARIEKLEMIDKATGDIYCAWMEQGEWQKAKGECGSVEVAMAPVQQVQEKERQQEQIIEQVKEDLSPDLQLRVESLVQVQVHQQVQQEIREQVEGQIQVKLEEEIKELKEEKETKEKIKEEAEVEASVEAPVEAPVEVPVQEPVPPEPVVVPVEETPEPAPEPAAEPIIDPAAAASADAAIQEAAAALMDAVVWGVGAIIPKEVKQFSAMAWRFTQNTATLAVNLAAEAPQTLQKSTAGLMGPFVDLKDFINKKY